MNQRQWNELALCLVRKAVLAPSSHNTQPWVFRIGTSEIDLFADRSRALRVNDPEDRELTISCGAALMNLRVAASNYGFRVQVQLLPEEAEPDWLARATLSRDSGEPGAEGALTEFVEKRRTYRKQFAVREVDSESVEHLVAAAVAEGQWLRPLLSEETRQGAARLVAEGDAAQWADRSWRRELATWMRSRRRGDGLTVPALAAPVAQLVIRTFDMGGRVGAKNRELAETSPLLAVLGTERDDPDDWLKAGEALQRVLLVGCQRNLQASFLNQPIQVASLRLKLQNLIGGGVPQILLRLGYPVEEMPSAPRRQVGDVIEQEKWHTAEQARLLRAGDLAATRRAPHPRAPSPTGAQRRG